LYGYVVSSVLSLLSSPSRLLPISPPRPFSESLIGDSPNYSPYPLNSSLINSFLRCNVPSNSIPTILRSPHASLVIRWWYLCRESQSQSFILFVIYIKKNPETQADTQYDLFGALYRPNSTTDSAGHLGGIVAGLGAAMLFRKGRFPRGPRLR
jgi:hypothetical protein